MAKRKTTQSTKAPKMVLRSALRMNGINPDYDKWRDAQGLGVAVREALSGK